MLGGGAKAKEHAISPTLNAAIAVVVSISLKNSFHIVGHDERAPLCTERQKWSALPSEGPLCQHAAVPDRRMEACVGAHHLSRKLQALGPTMPG